MKKLPIGRQTFSELIEQDLLYVDKTLWVWKLVNEGKYYFFARPRRFGKSLLLSTLKSFFEGKQDLFKGLYIDKKETEWKKYPVVYIDYSFVDYRTNIETFNRSFIEYLRTIGEAYDIFIDTNVIHNYFRELVLKLKEQHGQVVVLIDEYDKPLVDTLLDKKKFNENRQLLNGFYGTIKGLDEHLRFVFLTGVSRFSKVGVFSGMNNLNDISMDEQFVDMVGFNQKELESYFSDYLKALKDKFKLSKTELLQHIRFWYNGFSWDGNSRLYNPFSILNLFDKNTFDNYWFSTGTPTFLIDLIKEQKQLPESFEHIKVNDLTGSSMNFKSFPLVPLLFQTGYLTISKVHYDGIERYYQLNYPNEEVRRSFLTYVLASFVEKDEFNIQP